MQQRNYTSRLPPRIEARAQRPDLVRSGGRQVGGEIDDEGGMSELKAVAVVCKVRRAADREPARRLGGGNRVSPGGAAANVDASV